jgi:hypothetical protein
MATRPLSLVSMLMAITLTPDSGDAQAVHPPTYDYDSVSPGVQGPTSPLFATPYRRFVRTFSVSVPILVPTIDLQAALPAGFIPIPTANPNVASITLLLSFQVMDGLPTALGPFDTLMILAGAQNTSLGRREVLVVETQESTQESIEAHQQAAGGSIRLAAFTWEIGEKNGLLDVRVDVDAGGGSVQVAAKGSAQLNDRVKLDPNPTPLRIIAAGMALPAFFEASQIDRRVVANNGTNVSVRAKTGRLEIQGGASLAILGVGSAFILSKTQEVWLAFE